MNINRVLLFCVLLAATTLSARTDDAFHNIYHSLKRFFTGDDKHASTASQHRRPPLKHSHAQSSPGEPQGNSSEPRTVVLPEATPVQGDRAAKPEDSKAVDVKPADVKAADVEAADVKAADVKAADVKAADVKAADVKAADVKAAETKPTDTRPVEVVVPSAKSKQPTPTANPSPVLRSVP